MKFTHGRGKYTRRAILESTVTDVRYISFQPEVFLFEMFYLPTEINSWLFFLMFNLNIKKDVKAQFMLPLQVVLRYSTHIPVIELMFLFE